MNLLSRIPVDYPNADKFKAAFLALARFVIKNGWGGACHATSAILYAIARRLGIKAIPCIGEAFEGTAPFDHSWLEIDGKPYDVAIAVPLNPECACAPVFAGIDVSAMRPAFIEYGIYHSGLGNPADVISEMDLLDYFRGCPSPDLFRLTRSLCEAIGFPIDGAWLEKNLAGIKRRYVRVEG